MRFRLLSAKRECHNYSLYDHNKKVYEGISNNTPRREQEHVNDDKKFTRMDVKGPAVSRETALERERAAIEAYCRNHNGKPPKYNEL
jgi:predicted GIY-YIG superfamily endonuclease